MHNNNTILVDHRCLRSVQQLTRHSNYATPGLPVQYYYIFSSNSLKTRLSKLKCVYREIWEAACAKIFTCVRETENVNTQCVKSKGRCCQLVMWGSAWDSGGRETSLLRNPQESQTRLFPLRQYFVHSRGTSAPSPPDLSSKLA